MQMQDSLIERVQALDARFSALSHAVQRPGLARRLAALLAHSGDSWFWLLGLGLLWLFGDEPWKRRAEVMALSILVTAAIVLAIKFSVRRSRPQGEWGQIYRRTDPHSFPSGHAARAALLATLALGLGPAWFGLLLLAWAPLVALSRASMAVHYLSDVLAGFPLGVVMGVLVLWIL
jgi:undecaprenyl-diphosphatase